ncbi:D-glycero-alpha-D-manno-heptose-1,7-bisphosphate 7-phosphatase [Thermodesulfobacteriota bacterium]
MSKPEQRFVLLDRDGTIIIERNYLSDFHQVELLPKAAEGLKRMQDSRLGIVIITNQSGIGRGYLNIRELNLIHNRMMELLAAQDIKIDGIYFCPHIPEENCKCRKPGTGLVEEAQKNFGFNPSHCFVIGDKPCDIELGNTINATTFLVRTGYGKQTETEGVLVQDYVVNDLVEASTIIKKLLNEI